MNDFDRAFLRIILALLTVWAGWFTVHYDAKQASTVKELHDIKASMGLPMPHFLLPKSLEKSDNAHKN